MPENIQNTLGTSQDIPNATNFKNVLKPYLIWWGIVYAVLITCITFIAVCISRSDWELSQRLISWFMSIGAIMEGDTIRYGMLVLGTNHANLVAAGVNVAGVFAFGINCSGVVAFGVNSGGVIAIGTNAVGLVAIGVNACGIFAIGCSAFGIVAIGQIAFGTYALSFSQTHKTKAKYLFAPHRQDSKAIDLFERWFPKLTPTET